MTLELEPERPFLERLPLGALPGPRRLWVETYSHSNLRTVQL
jgi:hypothetical protein